MNKQQRLTHRIAVLALAGFVSPLPVFAQDSAKTASLAGEAIAAKESGDLVTAKAKLEEILKLNPADESAKGMLSDVNKGLLAGADVPKAVSALDKAAEENLNLFREVDGAALEASELAKAGNPDGAVALLEQAAAALPDNTAGQVQKDRLALLKNRILSERDAKNSGGTSVVAQAAIADKTRESRDNVTAGRRLISQARSYISDGRFADAEAALAKADAILPTNETASVAREELKAARGKRFEAMYAAAVEKRDMTAARVAVEGYEGVNGVDDRRSRDLRANFEEKLADPHFKSISEISPAFAEREKKANELLAKARAQYLYGDYLGALESYKDVLVYQPLNTEAKSFSIRIRELVHDKSGRYNAEISRKKLLEDVDNKWATAEVFDRNQTNTGGNTEVESPVLKKMKSIKVGEITIRDLPLDKAIESISEASRIYDKDGKGVNITLFDPEHKNPTVSIVLRDLPLNQVLEQVLRTVNYSYAINELGVVEVRSSNVNTELETEFFSLSTLAVTRMTGVSNKPAGGGDTPFGGGGGAAAGGGESPASKGLKDYFRSLGIGFDEAQGTGLTYDGVAQLAVTHNRRTLDRIRNILRRYSDVKQVNIESKFIDVTQGTLNQIATNWTVTNTKTVNGVEVTQLNYASGNRTLDSAFRTNSGGAQGRIVGPDMTQPTYDAAGNITGTTTTAGLNVPIPNNAPATPNGQNYGGSNNITAFNTVNGAQTNFAGTFFSSFGIGGYEVGLYVQALEQATGSDLMAAPSLTVTNGQAATIKVAQLLRYPESYSQIQAQVSQSGGGSVLGGGGGNNASVAITAGTPQDFTVQEVGVVMEVTPQIRDDNETIDLDLKPKITEFEGFVEYGGTSVAIAGGTVVTVPSGFYQPVFSIRSVETKVTVYDGATVIIGGLTREEVRTVHDKVPVLGDLPLVGKLFQSNGKTSTKRNLMIFITANMISPTGSTARSAVGGIRNGTTFSNPTLALPSGSVYRTPSDGSKADK